MARKRKAPRLWLRPERKDAQGKLTHAATWIILDGKRQVSTGYDAEQRGDAENALLAYCETAVPVPRTLYVYFVTTEQEGFPIKIGITESHSSRVSGLQTGLPYRVKVLAVMPTQDPMLERRLHRKFAHIRLEGEWFARKPELLDYIESLVAGSVAA